MKVAFYSASFSGARKGHIPTGIGFLMSAVEKHKIGECKYCTDVKDIVRYDPDFLCVSSTSQVIQDAYTVATKVKEQCPRTMMVLGGYHITALPKTLQAPFDVGVLSEGEWTLCALLCEWSGIMMDHIPGICFLENGKVVVNERQELEFNLDNFPHPKKSYPYPPYVGKIFGSRGCIYRCDYCGSSKHWGRKQRSHSAKYIAEECKQIYKQYHIRNLEFLDDIFATDLPHMCELEKELEKNGILGKVSFRGFVRANCMTDKMAIQLKRLNFSGVRFGAESGSQRVLDKLKRYASVKNNQEAIDILRDHKLGVSMSFMVGSVGETPQDLNQTYNFIKKNASKAHVAGLYLLSPCPGTKLWDYAMEQGLVTEDQDKMDWSTLMLDVQKPNFSWSKCVYLNEDTMSRKQLKYYVNKILGLMVPKTGWKGK